MTRAQDQKDERDAALTAERERLERESAAEIERNNQQAMTDRKPASAAKPEDQTGAAARMQAFEDEHLGKDAVRINGQIERGIGSPFAKLSDAHRAQHVALENLVAAEAALIAANAALSKADADCQMAAKVVEAAEEKANAAAV